MIRRLTVLWIALQADPAWGDHSTPLQAVAMSRTAAALTLAALLVVVIVIGVAVARVFMASRDESEPE